MIEAVIFDMDGLLIDSEPYWQDAEMIIFPKVGIHLTRDQCKETMGWRLDEVVQYRYSQKPWQGPSLQEVETEIIDKLIELVLANAAPMPGVHEIIGFFQSKGVKLGLASSSAFRIIHAVLDKFELKNAFEVVHSAEAEAYGKPHPAIYLSAAKMLQANPIHTLAIEDSFFGLISAIAARMLTIAIPEPAVWEQTRFDIAHLKLHSLTDFQPSHWEQLNGLLKKRIG